MRCAPARRQAKLQKGLEPVGLDDSGVTNIAAGAGKNSARNASPWCVPTMYQVR